MCITNITVKLAAGNMYENELKSTLHVKYPHMHYHNFIMNGLRYMNTVYTTLNPNAVTLIAEPNILRQPNVFNCALLELTMYFVQIKNVRTVVWEAQSLQHIVWHIFFMISRAKGI